MKLNCIELKRQENVLLIMYCGKMYLLKTLWTSRSACNLGVVHWCRFEHWDRVYYAYFYRLHWLSSYNSTQFQDLMKDFLTFWKQNRFRAHKQRQHLALSPNMLKLCFRQLKFSVWTALTTDSLYSLCLPSWTGFAWTLTLNDVCVRVVKREKNKETQEGRGNAIVYAASSTNGSWHSHAEETKRMRGGGNGEEVDGRE